MIRSSELLTSLQAASTQPSAILRLLLVKNQMLVISAACRVHAVKYVLSLSIHSLSSVSFCLHSVLRLRMCALDFMHKLFLMSFVPLCVYVGRVCACVSLVYESWRLLKTLRSKHTLVRFYNTSHIHMLKNTQKHFQSHIDRRQRSKSIFFLAFTFG